MIERNLQTVRASETTVDLPIDIENGISLRHFVDLFHVEGLRPRSVEQENSETTGGDHRKQRDLPAVAEKAISTFLFSGSETSEQFHSRYRDNFAIYFAYAKPGGRT